MHPATLLKIAQSTCIDACSMPEATSLEPASAILAAEQAGHVGILVALPGCQALQTSAECDPPQDLKAVDVLPALAHTRLSHHAF